MSSSCSLNLLNHHNHQVPHSHNPIRQQQQQQQQHSVRSSNHHHHHRFKRLCLLAFNSNSTNTTTTTTTTSFDPGSTIYTSSVLQSPPSRHAIALNFIACVTAVSATWLFLSAIPMLLAFKRAAESLEKLLDVTREELPDTMAAVRLSGMEISDLTMELSDLGQEITQGVKSSTCAVRLAEERLRSLTNMNPPASMQVVVQMKPEQAGPVVARRARTIRENIVKSRAFMQMFFSITQFSKVAFKYLRSRSKSKA